MGVTRTTLQHGRRRVRATALPRDRRPALRLVFMLPLAAWCAGAVGPALAADEPDWLPETKNEETQRAPAAAPASGRYFLELAGDRFARQDSLGTVWRGNVGLDGYATPNVTDTWRATLSGRLDLDTEWADGERDTDGALTLREAYLSGPAAGLDFTVGRINIRDGVALGYNPSDVFRAGSLLVRRTNDPARLRESRLGVVGLRVQRSLPFGDVAGLVAPHIGDADDPKWYDPQLGAVNDGRAQAYVKYTPPRWGGLYTSAIWHKAKGAGSTWGFNATNNIGSAVVAYLEYARTQQRPLLRAADPAAPADAVSQLATGLTWTTPFRLSATVEYNYNGAGIDRAERRQLEQTGPTPQLGAAFATANFRQDPLSRHSVLVLLQQDRFLSHNAELACLLRASLVDRSRFGWCEWRYRQPAAEWSLNASRFHGDAASEFGAARVSWAVGAKVRFYH